MKFLRIGFDAKRIFNNISGLGQYGRFLTSALMGEYPEHHFYMFTPSIRYAGYLKEFKHKRSLTIVKPKTPFLKNLWRVFFTSRHFYYHKLDVFHGLSNELPYQSMQSKIKLVVTVHDTLFEKHPEFYKKIDKHIYRLKMAYACRKADKIVTVSEASKMDICEYFKIDASKIDVVYQGCMDDFYIRHNPDDLKEFRKKYNLPEHFILQVGTLEERKNALITLKAINALKPDMPFLVLAGKPTSYLKLLEEYVHKNNLSNQVIFIHTLQNYDMPYLYQCADLFIYPSLAEGFGIPVLEAMLSEIPVVCSDRPVFHEVGGDSAMFFNLEDETDLAHSISTILSDSASRKKMVESGLEHLKKFQSSEIADKMMGVYQSIL